jgi:hypothetical protein
MISSSNRISRREEVNELFQQLGQTLEQKVEALLIGGAVMLKLGLKDATKDIDIVCRSEEDKEALLASAKTLGFQIVGPEKRHERLWSQPDGGEGRAQSGHLRQAYLLRLRPF